MGGGGIAWAGIERCLYVSSYLLLHRFMYLYIIYFAHPHPPNRICEIVVLSFDYFEHTFDFLLLIVNFSCKLVTLLLYQLISTFFYVYLDSYFVHTHTNKAHTWITCFVIPL